MAQVPLMRAAETSDAGARSLKSGRRKFCVKKKGIYLTEREARYLASLIQIEGGVTEDEYSWRFALRGKLKDFRGRESLLARKVGLLAHRHLQTAVKALAASHGARGSAMLALFFG